MHRCIVIFRSPDISHNISYFYLLLSSREILFSSKKYDNNSQKMAWQATSVLVN